MVKIGIVTRLFIVILVLIMFLTPFAYGLSKWPSTLKETDMKFVLGKGGTTFYYGMSGFFTGKKDGKLILQFVLPLNESYTNLKVVDKIRNKALSPVADISMETEESCVDMFSFNEFDPNRSAPTVSACLSDPLTTNFNAELQATLSNEVGGNWDVLRENGTYAQAINMTLGIGGTAEYVRLTIGAESDLIVGLKNVTCPLSQKGPLYSENGYSCEMKIPTDPKLERAFNIYLQGDDRHQREREQDKELQLGMMREARQDSQDSTLKGAGLGALAAFLVTYLIEKWKESRRHHNVITGLTSAVKLVTSNANGFLEELARGKSFVSYQILISAESM